MPCIQKPGFTKQLISWRAGFLFAPRLPPIARFTLDHIKRLHPQSAKKQKKTHFHQRQHTRETEASLERLNMLRSGCAPKAGQDISGGIKHTPWHTYMKTHRHAHAGRQPHTETHSHVLLGFRCALMRPSQSLRRSARQGGRNFKRPPSHRTNTPALHLKRPAWSMLSGIRSISC